MVFSFQAFHRTIDGCLQVNGAYVQRVGAWKRKRGENVSGEKGRKTLLGGQKKSGSLYGSLRVAGEESTDASSAAPAAAMVYHESHPALQPSA